MSLQSEFKAAWWLSNPHLQTMAAKWLRRNEKVITSPEMLELPDGDFIDLAWTEVPETNNTRPIVLLLHGLEGSVNSHYVKGMLNVIKQKGWIGVLMHFRGCSGRPNRQAASYHSGDTRDINFLSSLLKQRYSQSKLFLIGFSLGGNVISRYLAAQRDNPYSAAVIICAPLHLASCSDRINQGISKIYQKYLLNMLKKSTEGKINQKIITRLFLKKLGKINTIFEFDQYVTAPLNGFSSANDYYQQSSGLNVLVEIQQPCLFIHAQDDPFLSNHDICLSQALPNNITFEVSKKGGHVGFISGNNPLKPYYWLEHRAPNFLEQYV